MKRRGLGIIGAGFGWRVLKPAFERTGSFTVKGVWARTERSHLDGPIFFPSWEKLIEDPGVEVLAVAVPPFLQPRILRLAARFQKPVFFEKPLAADLRSAHQAAQALRKSRVPAMIDFEFTELPVWKEFIRRVKGGDIGPLSAVAVTWEADRPPVQGRSWKDSEQKGGGLLLNFGSHVIDYLEILTGRIARVKTQEKKSDSVQFLFESQRVSGAVRICRAPGLSPRHEVLAVGTAGFLLFRNSTRDYVKGFILEGMGKSGQQIFYEDRSDRKSPEDGRIEAVRRMAEIFSSRLKSKNHRPDFVERALRSAVLLDRLKRSRGTWVAA